MGRVAAIFLLAVSAVVMGGIFRSAPAWAAATHSFDATLSLTGACSTSPEDSVADPGCPGGSHPPAIWSCGETGCSGTFSAPSSITTDEYGDIYVASWGQPSAGGAEGRIDIFNSEGLFLTEVVDPGGPKSIAVDAAGVLYARDTSSGKIKRFVPSRYEPAAGHIEYANAPVVFGLEHFAQGIAVIDGAGPSFQNHLLVDYGNFIAEFGSAVEGNPILDESIGVGSLPGGESIFSSVSVAVDATRKLIYASSADNTFHHSKVRVFHLEAPHALVRTIDGSTTPAGEFKSTGGDISMAVDEENGHVFVDDMFRTSNVYEFTETEELVSEITHSFHYVFPSQIWMDNGAHSPNGALDLLGRYLFVPSNETGVGHAYAFAPHQEGPPIVGSLSVGGITETEAQLHASVNPNGGETHYRFEYASAQQVKESGYAGALLGGEGTLAAETQPSEVSASLAGLSPGTAYRFRVVAENGAGKEEAEGHFATYPEAAPSAGSCPNEGLRTGLSAALPDCRAYELVTPPDTGGRPPYDPGNHGGGDRFGTPTASPGGDSVAFITAGGAIPGTEAAGGFNGSLYVSKREAGGWGLESAGLSGTQSQNPLPGGLSADHGYAISTAREVGSLVIGGKETRYLRHPDGSFHLLGEGSIGSQPAVIGLFVAPHGSHAIFTTAAGSVSQIKQLEPNAPPSGTAAIYDRTPDETLHVVSLLPPNVTPGAGEGAEYLGASAQGNAVAFKVGTGATLASSPLYVRLNDAETLEAAGGGATFAGLSADGRYLFYLSGGDLFRYDAQERTTVRITSSHDATVVNVPADGTGVYFVSPTAITGEEENPNKEKALAGAQNLYLWSGGTVRFVGRVTEGDVKGELSGLGLWVPGLVDGKAAKDPSRSTPDGQVLEFESRADLTSFEAGGRAEVYRFDAAAGQLSCLSCSPTEAPAASNARLQSLNPVGNSGAPEPTGRFALVPDLSANGRRAFFETSEALVAADTDGVQDVYEWEAQGEGSCTRPGGCTFLISSGHSARDNYLYGVSESGNDVFISTTDLLVGADHDATPSIYDARVGGGFPEAGTTPCQGEGCRPTLSPGPVFPSPVSPVSGTSGNLHPCPPRKHRAKRKGRSVCVKSRHRHHHARHGRGAGK